MSELGEICESAEAPQQETCANLNETKILQNFKEKFNPFVVEEHTESSLEPGEVVSPVDSPAESPVVCLREPVVRDESPFGPRKTEVLGRDGALKRLKAFSFQKKLHDAAKEKLKEKKKAEDEKPKQRRKSEADLLLETEKEAEESADPLNKSFDTVQFGMNTIYRIRPETPVPKEEAEEPKADVKPSTSLEAIKSYSDEKEKEEEKPKKDRSSAEKRQARNRERYKERSPVQNDQFPNAFARKPNFNGPIRMGGPSGFYKPRGDFRDRHFHRGRHPFMPRHSAPGFPTPNGGNNDSFPTRRPEEKFRPASYADRERSRMEKKLRKRQKSRESLDLHSIIKWTEAKPSIGFITKPLMDEFKQKAKDQKSKRRKSREEGEEKPKKDEKETKKKNDTKEETEEARNKRKKEEKERSKEKKAKRAKKSKEGGTPPRNEKVKDDETYTPQKPKETSEKKQKTKEEEKKEADSSSKRSRKTLTPPRCKERDDNSTKKLKKEEEESNSQNTTKKEEESSHKSSKKTPKESEQEEILDKKSERNIEEGTPPLTVKVKEEKLSPSKSKRKDEEKSPSKTKSKDEGLPKIKEEEATPPPKAKEPEETLPPQKKKKIDKIVQRSLSFSVDEFTFPEEDSNSQQADEETPKAVKEENKNSSPDTDDYMDNWETEVEYGTSTGSSVFGSSTPLLSQPSEDASDLLTEAEMKVEDELLLEMETEKEEEPRTPPQPVVEDDESQDAFNAFINPSPPAEFLNQTQEVSTTPRTSPPNFVLKTEEAEKPVESTTPPIMVPPKQEEPKKVLFAMQDVYNQFMKSVEESGIHLSSESEQKVSVESPIACTPPPASSDSSSSVPSSSSDDEDDDESSQSSSSPPDTPPPTQSMTGDKIPNFELFSQQDVLKIKQLQENLSRIRLIRESYDSSDDLYDELIKMESIIVMQRDLVIQKYASVPVPTFVSTLQQAESFTAEDNDAPPNKILNSNREAIKLVISPIKLRKTGALMDDREDSEPETNTPPPKADPPPVATTKEQPPKAKDDVSKSKTTRRRSRSPVEKRRTRDRARSTSISPHRRRNRLSKSPGRRSGASRGEARRKAHGRSRSRSFSPKRPNRHSSPGPSRRKRDERKYRGRSRSPQTRRRSSRSPFRERYSPLPFKPPSPPSRRSSSHSRSASVDRSKAKGASPGYYSGSHYYPSDGYYSAASPDRIPLEARINLELNNGSTPNYDGYSNYNAYGYPVAGAPTPTYPDNPYTGQQEQSYSSIPTISGVSRAPNSNYYYGDFGAPGTSNQNTSVIKEIPMAAADTSQEASGESSCTEKVVPIPPIVKLEITEPTVIVPPAPRRRSSHRKSFSWKEEVNNRNIASAVLKLRRENDGSTKGILKTAEGQNSPKQKKTVYFQDGIFPNVDSNDEDNRIIAKKLRGRIRRLKKVRGIPFRNSNKENWDTDSDSDYEDNPPPPPVGSPPSHLAQPVYKGPPLPPWPPHHPDMAQQRMYSPGLPFQGVPPPTEHFSPSMARLNSPLIRTPDSPHLAHFAQNSPRPPMYGTRPPPQFARLNSPVVRMMNGGSPQFYRPPFFMSPQVNRPPHMINTHIPPPQTPNMSYPPPNLRPQLHNSPMQQQPTAGDGSPSTSTLFNRNGNGKPRKY